MAKPRTKTARPKRGEYYTYFWGAYEFDVDRALEMVGDGREPVEVEEESVRLSVEDSAIDAEHVATVNLALPGIIAFIHYRDEEGTVHRGHVLIDGHHRAARCLQEGRPFFAYLLDEEESVSILLKSPQTVAV